MRDQEFAFVALFVMSVWNVLLGVLMIGEVVSVTDGMLFAFPIAYLLLLFNFLSLK